MGLLSYLFGSKKPAAVKKAVAPKIEGKVSDWEKGVVKSYSEKKGFGFVTVGKTDVFVHNSTLPKAITTLKPGKSVLIRYGKAPKGIQAVELKLA